MKCVHLNVCCNFHSAQPSQERRHRASPGAESRVASDHGICQVPAEGQDRVPWNAADG